MKTILEMITIEMEQAFTAAGYDIAYAKVSLSNRPDLCEYQCNGALAAAKVYKKAPLVIANEVVEKLPESSYFEMKEAVLPGFINLKLTPEYLAKHLQEMATSDHLGVNMVTEPKTIIVDYGGPNVAKPLHIGHLRSAIIGESVKRIVRFKGNHVIGDIHLGDWGYQMGLVITELEKRSPELPYFDENYTGEYPKEPPFTIGELEEIYPYASVLAKEDEEYRKKALRATYFLQNGHPGYTAIWRHIMDVSVADLGQNYANLNVEFDLWRGEADAQKYIPDMIEMLKESGVARFDDGALVIDVQEETDKKEIPPFIILKSDGAALYGTTDLATIVEREKLYQPDQMIYLTDKRQDLHFVQLFRAAKKSGIISADAKLDFIGFGTMNGKDGKPFKTREGGVMRLEDLISQINVVMGKKIQENRTVSEDEADKTARIVGLAALKYGDLSNQATKDYVFDIERFTSFEGNTGPYILYTMVRISSILQRYQETGATLVGLTIQAATGEEEKALMLEVAKFQDVINGVYEEIAPHKLCAYIYDLANVFNRFYHETKILAEEDEEKKKGYLALLKLTRQVLGTSIDLLGFSAPERM